MTSALAPFDFQGQAVRVVLRDGEPLWVAADVCSVLGIAYHRDALARLDEDERGSVVVDTLGGPQETGAVNESGLYHLIFQSRKAVAVAFRRFVTSEVLPSIRRTGGYGTLDPAAIRDLVRQEMRSVVAAEVRAIAAETVRADFALLRREIRTLEGWTLEDFARRRRVPLTAKQARSIGGALAAICRGAGLPMGRQASEYRRGTPPRTYPRTVLELHFARLVDRHAPSPQLALVAAAPASPQIPA